MDDAAVATPTEVTQSDQTSLSAEDRMAKLFGAMTGETETSSAGDQTGDQPGEQAEGSEPSEVSEDIAQDTDADNAADNETTQTTQNTREHYESTPEGREKIEVATAALKRDRWSDEDIAALPADTLVRMGEERRQSQAEIDRLGNRYHDLQEELEELRAEAGIEDSYDDPDLAKIAESDPELARRLADKQQDLQDAAVEVEANQVRETVREGMRDLETEYPQLGDSQVREQVIQRMSRLAQSGAYDDRVAGQDLFTEVLETAVRIELGQPSKQTAQANLLRSTDAQRLGQPEVTTGSETPVDMDPDDWALQQLEEGKMTHDEINRKYNAMVEARGKPAA